MHRASYGGWRFIYHLKSKQWPVYCLIKRIQIFTSSIIKRTNFFLNARANENRAGSKLPFWFFVLNWDAFMSPSGLQYHLHTPFHLQALATVIYLFVWLCPCAIKWTKLVHLVCALMRQHIPHGWKMIKFSSTFDANLHFTLSLLFKKALL